MKQIGIFSEKVVSLLSLDIEAGTPIFIGRHNEQHIRDRHPAEYDLYYSRIEEIIDSPNYVGKDPKTGSIDFVKTFQTGTEYVQVAVRINASGIFVARTLFLLATYNAERYIRQGTLIKLV